MGKNNKLFRERMKATKPDIEEIAYRDKQPKKVEKEQIHQSVNIVKMFLIEKMLNVQSKKEKKNI